MKNFKIFILIIYCNHIYSQSEKKYLNNYKNLINYEVMGHSQSLFSLNYERYFNLKNEHLKLTFRTGVGILEGYTASDNKRYNQGTIIPNVITLLYGKKVHLLQLGLGYSSTFKSGLRDETSNSVFEYQRFTSSYSLSLGYRFMPDRIIMQAFPILIRDNVANAKIEASFGMSIGYLF